MHVQYVPVSTLTVRWTRQSGEPGRRLSPPLPPYFCITHPHHSSYTLDMPTRLRRTSRRRHDQNLPPRYRKDTSVASTPQTLI
jgi:hypothetical protein